MTTRAVLVAAGYGTRLLPLTRVVPKELLPIGARPALDLVVEELADAGITDLLVVTQRRKRAVEDWFDHDPELEAALAAKPERLALARPPAGMRVQFIRQASMRGTGDALRLAADFAQGQPLLVAFPDDLFGDPNPSRQLLDVWRQTGCSVLGALDLGDADPSPWGILDATADGDLWRVRGVVEKPSRAQAPSRLASVGRFVYTPSLLQAVIRHLDDASSDEQTPMPGFAEEGQAGRLVATVLQAPRWDIGQPQGWARCVVDNLLDDPNQGAAFRAWLTRRLADDPAD